MQRLQILRHRSAMARVRSTFQSSTATRCFSSYPDHEVVGLPALSPTMETGTIAQWNKKEGDQINPGDVLCQVETDKAVMDFEAQDEFVLAKILKPEGTSDIQIGEPICVTVADKDSVSAFKDFSVEESKRSEAPKQEVAPEQEAPQQAPEQPKSAPQPTPQASRNDGDRVFASPLARKIARESGAVLSAINGSGPRGRIVRADVEEALKNGQATAETQSSAESAPAAASPSASGAYTDYPVSNEAQTWASELAQQKQQVPHYHLSVDLHMDKVLQARKQLNAGRGEDEQLSVNDFMIRAASLAMKTVPSANASWQGTFIRQYHDCNVNLMVSTTDGGIVAPVIGQVNRKGLAEINERVREIMGQAREGNVEVSKGTFTVSNVGMFDVRSLQGIVSKDQAGFLGLGTINKKVVPNEDPNATQIYKYAHVMNATLALDHRVVDGAVGAEWMAAFKQLVEDPLKMIL